MRGCCWSRWKNAMIDLSPNHLATVRAILAEHVPECEIRAFGSRVTWTAKDYSDLDLAVVGKGPVDWRTLSRLREAFEESDLPIQVDVLDSHAISDSFKEVIEQDYVVLRESVRQAMLGGWREVALGEIADVFDGPHATPQKTDSGPVFLGISNLVDGRTDLSTTQHLSEDDYSTWTRRVTPMPGDIVFSYETRLGEAAAIPHGLRCCLGRRMGLLRARTQRVEPQFLLYAYLGPRFQETLRARAVQGSTVDRILLSEMGSFPITIPVDLREQRAIAHVLGTLDDKIEMNRRMNETLEEMARALFKSWFVDFDPVRAKMEGRWRQGESLPGLPADLYDLFPDRLVPSELGKIPEGWEVGVLDDAVRILSGGTPKTSMQEYWDGDIPWYTVKDAPSLSDIFVLTTERSITQTGVENSSTKVLPVGTTVISARGTVGRLACLGSPMAINQTCYGLRGASGYPDYFTYWNLRNTVSDLQARTHGTIFSTITRQTFTIVATVMPPLRSAVAFEAVVGAWMERIMKNLRESESLAAQRDGLLPRLVSRGSVGKQWPTRIEGYPSRSRHNRDYPPNP